LSTYGLTEYCSVSSGETLSSGRFLMCVFFKFTKSRLEQMLIANVGIKTMASIYRNRKSQVHRSDNISNE
jgi:hypothetical protein